MGLTPKGPRREFTWGKGYLVGAQGPHTVMLCAQDPSRHCFWLRLSSPQHSVQESVKAATAMHTPKGHSAVLQGPSLPEHSGVRGEAGGTLRERQYDTVERSVQWEVGEGGDTSAGPVPLFSSLKSSGRPLTRRLLEGLQGEDNAPTSLFV